MQPRTIHLEERDPLPPPPPAGLLRTMFGAKPRPPATLPEGMRLYAIGDVHGRLDLLDDLLRAIRDDSGTRGDAEVEVVLLGDLIDRGPDSAGVVRRAMTPLDWADLHVLRGNHEYSMMEALHGDRTMARLWLDHGGTEALASWGVDAAVLAEGTLDEVIEAARAAVPAKERAWLSRRPVSLLRGDYYFVHAGVRPGIALDQQSIRDALWIRDEFLSSARDHGVTVVHGHSVAVEIEERANRIGIDTGAHATGRLTALGLEASRRWTLQT